MMVRYERYVFCFPLFFTSSPLFSSLKQFTYLTMSAHSWCHLNTELMSMRTAKFVRCSHWHLVLCSPVSRVSHPDLFHALRRESIVIRIRENRDWPVHRVPEDALHRAERVLQAREDVFEGDLNRDVGNWTPDIVLIDIGSNNPRINLIRIKEKYKIQFLEKHSHAWFFFLSFGMSQDLWPLMMHPRFSKDFKTTFVLVSLMFLLSWIFKDIFDQSSFFWTSETLIVLTSNFILSVPFSMNWFPSSQASLTK